MILNHTLNYVTKINKTLRCKNKIIRENHVFLPDKDKPICLYSANIVLTLLFDNIIELTHDFVSYRGCSSN